MSPTLLISIALGGAIGAIGRYLVMSGAGHWLGHGFPAGTLIVNIIGSFFLGSLIEVMALVWSPGEEMRAFIVIGVLGSFTTFSAFSMDTIHLIDRGNYLVAGGYVAGSVVASVVAFMAGMAVFRQILS